MENHDMRKINLDYHMIKDMREEKTLHEISKELNVSVRTIMRFVRKNNLKLIKPYQVGKKMCVECRKYYNKENLRSNRKGLVCNLCFYEQEKRWKYHYQ